MNKAALQEPETHLRLAIEAAGMVTWQWDIAAGTILYSDNVPTLAHGQETERYGSVTGLIQEVHPDDRDRLADAIRQTTDENRPFDCEYRVRMLDGIYHWVHGKGSIVAASGHKPTRLLGVSIDISARKQAEQTLREQELLLRSFFDSPGMLRGTAEVAGDDILILSANHALAATYRRPVEAMQSVRASDLGWGAALIERWIAAALESHRQARPVSFEYSTGFRALGTWGLATIGAMAGGVGQPCRFAFVSNDITERKYSEIQLQVQYDLASVLGQSMPLQATLDKLLALVATIPCIDCAAVYLNSGETGDLSLHAQVGLSPALLDCIAQFPADAPVLRPLKDGQPVCALPAGTDDGLVGWIQAERLAGFCAIPFIHKGQLAGSFLVGSHVHSEIPRPCCAVAQSLVAQAAAGIVRLQAEFELAASQRRFQQVVLNIHEVFWMSDPTLAQIEYVSPAYAAIWGRTPAAAYASPNGWLESVHPEDRDRVAAAYRNLPFQEQHQTFRIVRPDGTTRSIEDRAFPVRDPEGRVCRIAGIAEDITKRKRIADLNAALLQLGLQLSAASTPAEVAETIAKIASDLFGWDAFFFHLYWLERDQVIPVLTIDTVAGQKQQIPHSAIDSVPSPMTHDVIRSGARLINRNPVAPVPAEAIPTQVIGDKTRRSASLIYAPIRHRTEVVGVVSIQSYTPYAYAQSDVAALQALADHCGGALKRIQSADQLQALQNEVLDLSHRDQVQIGAELHDDLSQTLGALALKAQLLADTLSEASLPHASAASSLAVLLNGALKHTRRLAQGLAPVELDSGGLPAALHTLTQEIQSSSGVECTLACSMPTLTLAPRATLHLYRIAQESIRNALRHSQPTRIEVSLTLDPPRLCLAVSNDGSGFSPNTQFTTGLGLRVMRYRAETIGGQLTVRSNPQGGTVIQCLLSDVTPLLAEALAK